VSRFYITTPIYYINAEPHLGHAYTTMIADASARAHRLMGDEVFFLTGTDEHGQKVERAAVKAGAATSIFADRVSQKFRDLSTLLNISNDAFIRTTEPRHWAASQELWRRVRDRGHIYKGQYEGWYCTVDEVFVPDAQLVDGRCPTCGNTLERIAEESYFFRLSAFQQTLSAYYQEHPEFITPRSRRNEVTSFVDAGLQDLSISRTSFKWGIPVPDDPAHVMYVWFDALTNYLTALGFGAADEASKARFEDWWPADVHLIGKEIVRQHAIYWPAFLMAADLPVPKQLVSHGWWLMDGAKMSKSVGNVVQPGEYVRRFGVDALRYFVMREMVFGQDASFTDEAFIGRYNADLANDLGNLVSRVTTMIHRYRGGVVPRADDVLGAREAETTLRQGVEGLIQTVKGAMESFQLSYALRETWDVIGLTNRYIVTREPWKLAKDPAKHDELDTTLYVAADTLRVIGELIRPFMPEAGERTLAMLGLDAREKSWVSLRAGTLESGIHIRETAALFPRIQYSVEELQQMSSDQPESSPATAPAETGTRHEPSAPSALNQAPAPQNAGPGAAPGAEPAPGTFASAATTSRISIDDFMKVELRVAKVLEAERVPKSKKLLKLRVDVGTEQRTVVAGIAESYEPETLIGRSIAIVFNLQPAKLMGIESNGMVLAASPDDGKAMLVSFDEPPAPGTRVR
jgi:methionyl-tRNA synthetase